MKTLQYQARQRKQQHNSELKFGQMNAWTEESFEKRIPQPTALELRIHDDDDDDDDGDDDDDDDDFMTIMMIWWLKIIMVMIW